MEQAIRNTHYSNLTRKLAVGAAIALTLAVLLGWARAWVGSTQTERGGIEGVVRRADFRSQLTGALIIADGNGTRLYDLQAQDAAQNRVLAPYFTVGDMLLPYNHLPFEAMLVAPFLVLGVSYPAIFGLWTLLTALAVGLSMWLMNRALPMRQPALLVFLLAACSYGPLIRSFILGQNSPLVLLGLCGTYAALRLGHPAWAGAALCLAALKPQVLPIVLLLLVLQREWRALATFAGGFAGLCVLAMPVLGVDWPLQYGRLLLGVASWSNTGAIDPGIMHNWRGFATNLFGGWAPGLVTPAFLLLSLASAGLLIWVWWRTRGTKDQSPGSKVQSPKSKIQNDYLWALAGLLAVLTSLHLNPHDLTLLIFPAWIVTAYATRGVWEARRSALCLAILWAGYVLTSLGDPTRLVVPSVLLMVLVAGLMAAAPAREPSALTEG
jgi:hypothetical protein